MPTKKRKATRKKTAKKRRVTVSAFKASIKRRGMTMPHGYELRKAKRRKKK